MFNDYSERSAFYDLEFSDNADLELVKHIISNRTKLDIVDIPSGTGRTLKFWQSMKHNVTLADISPQMLKVLNKKLQTKNINTCVADIKNLSGLEPFDAVFILREAFMFLNQDEASKAIKNIASTLRKGGICLIDLVQLEVSKVKEPELLPYYIATPEGEVDYDQKEPKEKRSLKRKHTSNYSDGMLNAAFTYKYFNGSELKKHKSQIRLFGLCPSLICKSAEACGLKIIKKWGYYDQRPHDKGSPRCILLLEKYHEA